MPKIEPKLNQSDVNVEQRLAALETEKDSFLDKIKKMDAISAPAPLKGMSDVDGGVKLDPPTSEHSLNLQALLLILHSLELVRDAKLSMRQQQQNLSIEASRNQITEMQKGMGWMIASAALTGIFGVVSVAIGVRCLFKNFQASRQINNLKGQKKDFELPQAKYSKGKDGEKLELVKSPDVRKLTETNQAKIDQLTADINSRNAFLQTMNGITQTIGATGNAITAAGKAQVDISVKQAELEALLARNQKEMLQMSSEQLDAMIQQIQRAIADYLQSEVQGVRSTA